MCHAPPKLQQRACGSSQTWPGSPLWNSAAADPCCTVDLHRSPRPSRARTRNHNRATATAPAPASLRARARAPVHGTVGRDAPVDDGQVQKVDALLRDAAAALLVRAGQAALRVPYVGPQAVARPPHVVWHVDVDLGLGF